MNQFLPSAYRGLKETLRVKLGAIERVALTLDFWTNLLTKRKYIAIIAHGINKDWTLERFLLDFRPVTVYAETGLFIEDEVLAVLDDWNINKSAVIAITTDGGSNVVNAVEEQLSIPRIWCFAHRLDLVVREGTISSFFSLSLSLFLLLLHINASKEPKFSNPSTRD